MEKKSGLSSLNQPKKKKPRNPFTAVADLFYTLMATLLKLIAYALAALVEAIAAVMKFIVTTVIKIISPIIEFISRFVRSTHYRAGSLFPFHIREKLEEMFLYSGLTRNPQETLGMALMYSILLPIALGLIILAFTSNQQLAATVAVFSFIIVWLLLYMLLNYLVDKRTSSIEKTLPDLLSMIAQNMSAGMTPYNALWVAARPEFGALADEIQRVARDTLTGTPLEAALTNMGKRVKSNKLRRTIKLMNQGMRSGGELPTVLQEIARDIRIEQNLVKRMESETTAQSLFILFSVVLGAPLLFAASSKFIEMFSRIFSLIDVGKLSTQTQSGMVKIQALAIKVSEFDFYATVVLVVCSFFGSLLIGLMRSGKMTRGIPLTPVIMVLSITMFYVMRFILSVLFSTMGMISA